MWSFRCGRVVVAMRKLLYAARCVAYRLPYKRESEMPRYTPSTEIPTAYAKILKTPSVVRSGVQSVIMQGNERRGNHDTNAQKAG